MSDFKADVLSFAVRTAPGGTAGKAKIYGKTFNSVACLASQSSDGTEYQLTPLTPADATITNLMLDSPLTIATGSTVPNSTGPHTVFPSGTITLAASTKYRMRGQFVTQRASSTSSNISMQFDNGTATFTSFFWRSYSHSNSADLQTAIDYYVHHAESEASAIVVSAVNFTHRLWWFEGVFVVNAGGTFIPQISFSLAPGGVVTIHRASFLEITPLGSGSFVQQGGWS